MLISFAASAFNSTKVFESNSDQRLKLKFDIRYMIVKPDSMENAGRREM